MHHEEPTWARGHPLRPKRHGKAQLQADQGGAAQSVTREPGGQEANGATAVANGHPSRLRHHDKARKPAKQDGVSPKAPTRAGEGQGG